VENSNLKKLHEKDGKKMYRVEVSNSLAALENLNAEMVIISLGKLN
jgi:hypothetical protein